MRNEAPEQPSEPGLAIATKITPSQQGILDQLHNHVAFSESLIFLSGPQGAGKSTIVEIFLEQASEYANLAYLPQPSKINTDGMRSKILRQLVKLDAYAADDSILEALQRNIKPGRQHLVICVDNGESLPATILSELQELATSRALFKPEQRVSVVIAGNAEWIKRASKGLALGSKTPPSKIEVIPFTTREQANFARRLVQTQPRKVTDEQIAAVLRDTHGYPGEIQQALDRMLNAPEASSKANTKGAPAARDKGEPKPGSGLNRALIILTLVAFGLALFVAWMLHQQPPESEAPTPEVIEETVVNEPQAETDVPVVVDDEGTSVAMDYNQAMSRLRERSASSQRDTQPPEERQPPVEQLTAPLSVLGEQPSNPSPVDAEPTNAEDSRTQASEHDPAELFDNRELWQRSPQRYVLQVAAFSDEQRLNLFLADFEHPQMRIYQTLREQQPWYFVVVGDFASADAARGYVTDEANGALQGLQPWPKSIAGVRQDLQAVMGSNAKDASGALN